LKTEKLSMWLKAPLMLGAVGVVLWLEIRRPLRRSVESKGKRNSRNLAIAGIGALAVQLLEMPLARPLTLLAERRQWGLLNWIGLPAWLENAIALILLDYTLYFWHVLNHRVPALWRFHLPHHVDLDLDASTGLRFHSGELALSVAWRAGQIVLIGVSPGAFSIWQIVLFASIIFHHSNIDLPVGIERWLSGVFVTPRMHGIHHSIVAQETNSNWSTTFSVWDRLHRTLQLNIPQQEITIGVPAYQDPANVTLPKVLAMPFISQRDDWKLIDGTEPTRIEREIAPTRLLA
jgi:sterol desaturase/sphingolipid hydroxylase (fatty acid hydroxylase superfamily)